MTKRNDLNAHNEVKIPKIDFDSATSTDQEVSKFIYGNGEMFILYP